MPRINNDCLLCKNVNSKQQLVACWGYTKREIDSILDKCDCKIEGLKEELEKSNSGNFKPEAYVDVRLKGLKIDECSYDYIAERILKYYFFVQKDLAQFFYSWKKLVYPNTQEFSFGSLHNHKIFGRMAQEKDFIYLEIIWSFANYYKHTTDHAESQIHGLVHKLFKQANHDLDFKEIISKAIALIDKDLNKDR